MRRKPDRAGYAMLLVLAFLVIFFALQAVAYRQLASALRSHTVRALQVQRDEGTIHALARGLALLETGYPPTNPYQCAVSIVTSTGSHSFTVTFAMEVGGTWTVTSAPTSDEESPPAMPLVFVSSTPP